jgi:branched-chain amino acid transport system permease protein
VSSSELIQQLVNGLSLGGTYALLALGLAMVFSIMGLINFAHGDLITIGGYVMWEMTNRGISWYWTIPVVLVATTLASMLMERIAFRRLRGASVVTLLITSFAVSFFIENAFGILISPRAQGIPVPNWLNQAVHFGSVIVPAVQVLTIVVVFVCLAFLAYMLNHTLLGTSMRAAAEDFRAAQLVGVRANRVVVSAFALGGLLAGVASVLYIARSGSVSPTSGFDPIVQAFIATVIGGLGNIYGAVVGGFVLGFTEVAFNAFLPNSVVPFSDAFALFVVIGLLLMRPHGILGRAGDLRA